MKKPISAEQLKRKVLRKISRMFMDAGGDGGSYRTGLLDVHEWLRAQPTGRGKR